MPQTTVVEIVLAVVTVLALSLALLAHLRLRRLTRDLLLARSSDSEQSIVESVASQVRQVQALGQDLEQMQQSLATVRRDVAAALRHVSVVRFDAFGDMGGRLSFSAALLDDNGDGILLTTIHGHTESRMYVKSVSHRKAEGRLSAEELEAINTASPIG